MTNIPKIESSNVKWYIALWNRIFNEYYVCVSLYDYDDAKILLRDDFGEKYLSKDGDFRIIDQFLYSYLSSNRISKIIIVITDKNGLEYEVSGYPVVNVFIKAQELMEHFCDREMYIEKISFINNLTIS